MPEKRSDNNLTIMEYRWAVGDRTSVSCVSEIMIHVPAKISSESTVTGFVSMPSASITVKLCPSIENTKLYRCELVEAKYSVK